MMEPVAHGFGGGLAFLRASTQTTSLAEPRAGLGLNCGAALSVLASRLSPGSQPPILSRMDRQDFSASPVRSRGVLAEPSAAKTSFLSGGWDASPSPGPDSDIGLETGSLMRRYGLSHASLERDLSMDEFDVSFDKPATSYGVQGGGAHWGRTLRERTQESRPVWRERHFGSLRASWLVRNSFEAWRELGRFGAAWRRRQREAEEACAVQEISALQRELAQREIVIHNLDQQLGHGPRREREVALRAGNRAVRACIGSVERRLLMRMAFAAFGLLTREAHLSRQLTEWEERYSAQLSERDEQHRSQRAVWTEVEERHRVQIADLEDQHGARLAEVEERHRIQLAERDETHRAQLTRWTEKEERYRNQFQDTEDSYLVDRGEIEERHGAYVRELEAGHERRHSELSLYAARIQEEWSQQLQLVTAEHEAREREMDLHSYHIADRARVSVRTRACTAAIIQVSAADREVLSRVMAAWLRWANLECISRNAEDGQDQINAEWEAKMRLELASAEAEWSGKLRLSVDTVEQEWVEKFKAERASFEQTYGKLQTERGEVIREREENWRDKLTVLTQENEHMFQSRLEQNNEEWATRLTKECNVIAREWEERLRVELSALESQWEAKKASEQERFAALEKQWETNTATERVSLEARHSEERISLDRKWTERLQGELAALGRHWEGKLAAEGRGLKDTWEVTERDLKHGHREREARFQSELESWRHFEGRVEIERRQAEDTRRVLSERAEHFQSASMDRARSAAVALMGGASRVLVSAAFAAWLKLLERNRFGRLTERRLDGLTVEWSAKSSALEARALRAEAACQQRALAAALALCSGQSNVFFKSILAAWHKVVERSRSERLHTRQVSILEETWTKERLQLEQRHREIVSSRRPPRQTGAPLALVVFVAWMRLLEQARLEVEVRLRKKYRAGSAEVAVRYVGLMSSLRILSEWYHWCRTARLDASFCALSLRLHVVQSREDRVTRQTLLTHYRDGALRLAQAAFAVWAALVASKRRAVAGNSRAQMQLWAWCAKYRGVVLCHRFLIFWRHEVVRMRPRPVEPVSREVVAAPLVTQVVMPPPVTRFVTAPPIVTRMTPYVTPPNVLAPTYSYRVADAHAWSFDSVGTCICGNHFLVDSIYCRMCGRKRPGIHGGMHASGSSRALVVPSTYGSPDDLHRTYLQRAPLHAWRDAVVAARESAPQCSPSPRAANTSYFMPSSMHMSSPARKIPGAPFFEHSVQSLPTSGVPSPAAPSPAVPGYSPFSAIYCVSPASTPQMPLAASSSSAPARPLGRQGSGSGSGSSLHVGGSGAASAPGCTTPHWGGQDGHAYSHNFAAGAVAAPSLSRSLARIMTEPIAAPPLVQSIEGHWSTAKSSRGPSSAGAALSPPRSGAAYSVATSCDATSLTPRGATSAAPRQPKPPPLVAQVDGVSCDAAAAAATSCGVAGSALSQQPWVRGPPNREEYSMRRDAYSVACAHVLQADVRERDRERSPQGQALAERAGRVAYWDAHEGELAAHVGASAPPVPPLPQGHGAPQPVTHFRPCW